MGQIAKSDGQCERDNDSREDGVDGVKKGQREWPVDDGEDEEENEERRDREHFHHGWAQPAESFQWRAIFDPFNHRHFRHQRPQLIPKRFKSRFCHISGISVIVDDETVFFGGRRVDG